MAKREPKGRNPEARALMLKIFQTKIIPAKKGKGMIYSRKGRTGKVPSGPFHVWIIARILRPAIQPTYSSLLDVETPLTAGLAGLWVMRSMPAGYAVLRGWPYLSRRGALARSRKPSEGRRAAVF